MTNVLNLELYLFDRQIIPNEEQFPLQVAIIQFYLSLNGEVKATFGTVKSETQRKRKK